MFNSDKRFTCTTISYSIETFQDPDETDFNIITCDSEFDGKHTSFAASFNVAPNTIDFSAVWSQFTNLDSNPVVFSVVIASICVYIILLVWSRRKDKLDKIRVMKCCSSIYNWDFIYFIILTQRPLGLNATFKNVIKICSKNNMFQSVLLQWRFHELEDNNDEGEYHYLISIQTALRPFSGTQCVPMCALVGDITDSGMRHIKSATGPKVYLSI